MCSSWLNGQHSRQIGVWALELLRGDQLCLRAGRVRVASNEVNTESWLSIGVGVRRFAF